LYENKEKAATLYIEKDFPSSKGSHFIIPKNNNPKYQIYDQGYKIEVGPG
jgi:hypothetical protein